MQEIYFYIARDLKEENIAKRTVKKIMNAIVNLCIFPKKYKRIKQSEDIRKMLLERYVVIYKVDNKNRKDFYFTYISWKSRLF